MPGIRGPSRAALLTVLLAVSAAAPALAQSGAAFTLRGFGGVGGSLCRPGTAWPYELLAGGAIGWDFAIGLAADGGLMFTTCDSGRPIVFGSLALFPFGKFGHLQAGGGVNFDFTSTTNVALRPEVIVRLPISMSTDSSGRKVDRITYVDVRAGFRRSYGYLMASLTLGKAVTR